MRKKKDGTTVLWECCVGFVHDSSCSYISVHFVNYSIYRSTCILYNVDYAVEVNTECLENISLMHIPVNNDLNHVQQVQWEERQGLYQLSCGTLKHRYNDSLPVCVHRCYVGSLLCSLCNMCGLPEVCILWLNLNSRLQTSTIVSPSLISRGFRYIIARDNIETRQYRKSHLMRFVPCVVDCMHL